MRHNKRFEVGDRVISLETLEPIQAEEEVIVREVLDESHAYDYLISFPSFSGTNGKGALMNDFEVEISYEVELQEAVAVLGEDYFA